MPAQTKEDLLRMIDEMREQIAELESQLSDKNAIARGTSEPGWLITTRNPEYSGVINGLHFQSGRAFLPKSHPQARMLYVRLVGDFGYQAQEITAKEFEDGTLPAVKKEKTFIEKISQPTIMNTQ